MEKYIISIDQGTTSCRTILFNKEGQIVDFEQKEFKQILPKKGWVEHDPIEIWETQLNTLKDLLNKNNLTNSQIDSIGITNQRETTVLWDKKTGKPVYNAIVWQDNRTINFCNALKAENKESLIRSKTGLVLDSYFSGSKINWLLNNIPELDELIENDRLLFGTIDTWLIWNLTKGATHATDVSNASRTLIFNINNLCWDDELLELFKIPKSILPEIKESSDDFGSWEWDGVEIPILGVAGDQQAALFGQCCFRSGMVKNTYGTGCFMLMNTGENPVISQNGLLTTIAWSINGKVIYALEGSVFIAGAAVQWLRDSLHIIKSAEETEEMANMSNDDSVIFVPAFSGLGAPYWNMQSKGAIFGLTRDTGINELCKATLESLALQSRDVILAMEKDANIQLKSLAVDGGACKNEYLMQFQADILNTQVKKPNVIESTALGAAYLAGLFSGFYNMDSFKKNHKIEATFTSNMDDKTRNAKTDLWANAINSIINMHN
tara:strand:+ start:390 stop:1868 length:1479 start_codon:yes stop_codon:yes gene_type:complete